jgi:diguanylate cyclase (GGDEF)-like protein
MALHDPLTQLPNRRVWTDRTGSQIGRPQTRCAVLLVDVNDFKIVNDSYGHEMGDTLLTEVARRLNTCVREGDLVARLGGDEFAILLSDIASRTDANDVEERIRRAFEVPFQQGSVELHVTVSVGIAFDEVGMTADGVLHHADIAMYERKRTKSRRL